MTGSDVALDTSAAVKLLNDLDLASCFLARVGKVHLPATAAGELLFGAMNSARREHNLPRYDQFIKNCAFIPTTLAVAEKYASLRLKLKSNGTPIPEPDIWIAAAALVCQLPLVTTDAHFGSVPNLSLFPLYEATL